MSLYAQALAAARFAKRKLQRHGWQPAVSLARTLAFYEQRWRTTYVLAFYARTYSAKVNVNHQTCTANAKVRQPHQSARTGNDRGLG